MVRKEKSTEDMQKVKFEVAQEMGLFNKTNEKKNKKT